jgi:hypothetical protein
VAGRRGEKGKRQIHFNLGYYKPLANTDSIHGEKKFLKILIYLSTIISGEFFHPIVLQF